MALNHVLQSEAQADDHDDLRELDLDELAWVGGGSGGEESPKET